MTPARIVRMHIPSASHIQMSHLWDTDWVLLSSNLANTSLPTSHIQIPMLFTNQPSTYSSPFALEYPLTDENESVKFFFPSRK